MMRYIIMRVIAAVCVSLALYGIKEARADGAGCTYNVGGTIYQDGQAACTAAVGPLSGYTNPHLDSLINPNPLQDGGTEYTIRCGRTNPNTHADDVINGGIATCHPPPPPPPCSGLGGTPHGVSEWDGGPRTAATDAGTALLQYSACDGSCETYISNGESANYGKPSSSLAYSDALVGGRTHTFITAKTTYTGNSCSSSNAATPPFVSATPTDTCGAGQVLGNFNGKNMCLAGGTTPVNPLNGQPTQSGTTTTTTPTTTAADGGTSSTATTTNPDGSQSVTTTSCDAAHLCNTFTTKTGEDPKDTNFCKENPTLPICKKPDDKTASAACSGAAAVVNCSGDAIQCAMLAEQVKQDCLLDAPTAEKLIYDGVVGGTDIGQTGNPSKVSNRTEIGLPAIDQSAHLQQSCIQDIHFTMSGGQVTIPVSRVCPWFAILGNIAVAFALVSAFLIIGRGN